jgi:L-asparagine transporter-like permease
MGIYYLFFDPSLITEAVTIKNLWLVPTIGQHTDNITFSGFYLMGWYDLSNIMALSIITFDLGGLELIGITTVKTEKLTKTIPKTINQNVSDSLRLLWFVMIFDHIDLF